jgi:hypothetical protein
LVEEELGDWGSLPELIAELFEEGYWGVLGEELKELLTFWGGEWLDGDDCGLELGCHGGASLGVRGGEGRSGLSILPDRVGVLDVLMEEVVNGQIVTRLMEEGIIYSWTRSVLGGCQPAVAQSFRTSVIGCSPLYRLSFRSSRSQVARPVGVVPMMVVLSADQMKCSDQFWMRGLNNVMIDEVSLSRPVMKL